MRGKSIHKLLFVAALQVWESADAKVDEYTYAKAPGNISQYTPKPQVGRPKGVKQKRVDFPRNTGTIYESNNLDIASWNTQRAPENTSQNNESLMLQNAPSVQGQMDISDGALETSGEATTSHNNEPFGSAVEIPGASGQRVQEAQLDDLRPSFPVVNQSRHTLEADMPQNNAQMEVLKPLQEATRSTELTRSTQKGQISGPIVKHQANVRKAVFIKAEESKSLGAPTPPGESITVEQAMEDDGIGWIDAIAKELLAVESTGTFTIIKGEPPVGRKLISSRFVLRYKLGVNSTERVKKARAIARGFER
ncbi:hypothetical protein K3495_g3675 [Podosphaera aphanis]|nr:hypothetical protein K3495_g3675 [Podosphaera aphanis]